MPRIVFDNPAYVKYQKQVPYTVKEIKDPVEIWLWRMKADERSYIKQQKAYERATTAFLSTSLGESTNTVLSVPAQLKPSILSRIYSWFLTLPLNN